MSFDVAKAEQADSGAGAGHDTSGPDDLIARAAHELRGSLGAISNWVHLLSQAAKDRELQQQGLAAIQRALEVSARLIEELSDVALLRSGRLRLRSGLVDLVPIVDMALEKPRAAAREKGVQLDVVRDVARVPVMGDPDRLQQIVLHLLGNAVKFTPAGGRVEVSIGRDAMTWQLAVSDTGPGLTPEFLTRVFGGLRPADFVAPREPASLGVGLTIVQLLAELHGGSVEASSPGPGRGARFVVRLPVPAVIPSIPAGNAAPELAADDPPAPVDPPRGRGRAAEPPPRLLRGT
jgi:signal transduction histidine kinase